MQEKTGGEWRDRAGALQLLLFHQHARGKELPIWAYTYTHTRECCASIEFLLCAQN